MPGKLFAIVGAVAVALGLTACDGTIYKAGKIDGVDTLSLGARQRLVVVNNKGGLNQDRRVVCAEPSPDAMAAIAASFSASGAFEDGAGKEIQAQVAASMQEAVASLGVRTQAIQLMRDGYYRACEAMMNGMIDSEEYRIILSNVDSAMVTLVAVDAIAGTTVAKNQAIAPATTSEVTVDAEGKPVVTTTTAHAQIDQDKTTKPMAGPEQAKQIADIVKTYLTLNDDVRTQAWRRSVEISKRRGHRHIKECTSNCEPGVYN